MLVPPLAMLLGLEDGLHLRVCSVYEMPSTLLRHLISTAWIFLCSFAVSVHVLHAWRDTEV